MTQIYIHNTLTGQKELFKPLHGPFLGFIGRPRVGMYHCGPTVYWDQHIGNMRAVVMSDLVRRVFMADGYRVNMVRNYTDVGHLTGDNLGDADLGQDRMEKAALREHVSPEAIAERYISRYERDISLLNVILPTHAPRATDHIEEMIDMVKVLVDKGFGYVTPLAVYFDVSKFPDYTRLSGQKLDSLESGEGHGVAAGDPNKRGPHDFALWFFKAGVHENALQTWKSPFFSPLVADGRGFPGWHIECSAMSKRYLGPTLDIHMGGVEHIPIHHTNEIAQSESANGCKFVDYWLHNEHLLVDGKKMSKSEGTSYLVRDIEARGYSPLALRYLFLQAHYRSKQNFTWDALAAADKALQNLRAFVSNHTDHKGGSVENKTDANKSAEYRERFFKAVNDDFNIPAGLAVVWELIKDSAVSLTDKKAMVLDFDKVLGLGLNSAVGRSTPLNEKDVIPDNVRVLVRERESARAKKDWKRSDELRSEIAALGYEVKDTAQGSEVSKA